MYAVEIGWYSVTTIEKVYWSIQSSSAYDYHKVQRYDVTPKHNAGDCFLKERSDRGMGNQTERRKKKKESKGIMASDKGGYIHWGVKFVIPRAFLLFAAVRVRIFNILYRYRLPQRKHVFSFLSIHRVCLVFLSTGKDGIMSFSLHFSVFRSLFRWYTSTSEKNHWTQNSSKRLKDHHFFAANKYLLWYLFLV